MERYFKRKTTIETIDASSSNKRQIANSDRSYTEINLEELRANPGLRTRISKYNYNIQDQVRIAYLQKGHCQPRNHTFPFKKFGTKSGRFNPTWFKEYPIWLEYNISKVVAFCLCYYLFKPEVSEESGGECFVSEELKNFPIGRKKRNCKLMCWWFK